MYWSSLEKVSKVFPWLSSSLDPPPLVHSQIAQVLWSGVFACAVTFNDITL
jgi:hypothetical protein